MLDYRSHIQKAIDYIEENLCFDIDINELAYVAGYSPYHFLRIFSNTVHLTPADYIRKRRLSEIAREIGENECISDIAFKYGFNSKENFIRAFKAEHNILPTVYKKSKNSLKLYDKIIFDLPIINVDPQIVTLEAFSLIAYQNNDEYIPRFWNRYNAKKMSLRLSGGKIVKDYGVCVWNSSSQKTDYYIGIKSEDAKGNLDETLKLTIPGGLYAAFATPISNQSDFVNNIHKTWDYIYRSWLPNSGYIRACGYEFECYIEESKTFSEEIYIPINAK